LQVGVNGRSRRVKDSEKGRYVLQCNECAAFGWSEDEYKHGGCREQLWDCPRCDLVWCAHCSPEGAAWCGSEEMYHCIHCAGKKCLLSDCDSDTFQNFLSWKSALPTVKRYLVAMRFTAAVRLTKLMAEKNLAMPQDIIKWIVLHILPHSKKIKWDPWDKACITRKEFVVRANPHLQGAKDEEEEEHYMYWGPIINLDFKTASGGRAQEGPSRSLILWIVFFTGCFSGNAGRL